MNLSSNILKRAKESRKCDKLFKNALKIYSYGFSKAIEGKVAVVGQSTAGLSSDKLKQEE